MSTMSNRAVGVLGRVLVVFLILGGISVKADILVKDDAGLVVTTEDVLQDMNRRGVPDEVVRMTLAQPDNVKKLASILYARKKIVAMAEASGLAENTEFKRRLVLQRDQMLSEYYLNHVAEAGLTDDIVVRIAQQDFAVNKDKYVIPETIQVRHILVSKKDARGKEKADELIKKIKEGADFAALAQQNSDDPGSREKGGDLGAFPRGKMVRPFEDAAFALAKPGDLSDVVESPFGWHIIQMISRTPANPRSFEDVKEELLKNASARIKGEKKRAVYEPLMESAPIVEDVVKTFASVFAVK